MIILFKINKIVHGKSTTYDTTLLNQLNIIIYTLHLNNIV